jgi:hypothetical protein
MACVGPVVVTESLKCNRVPDRRDVEYPRMKCSRVETKVVWCNVLPPMGTTLIQFANFH